MSVRIDCSGDQVTMRVADHGQGVPRAFVDQLFQRFERASTGIAASSEAPAFGLYLVRELAVANQGSADYQPHQPRGACFTVTLPAADPRRRSTRSPEARRPRRPHAAQPAAASRPPGAGPPGPQQPGERLLAGRLDRHLLIDDRLREQRPDGGVGGPQWWARRRSTARTRGARMPSWIASRCDIV